MKHFNFSLSQLDYCIAICLLFVLLLSGCGLNGSGDNSDEGSTSSETTSELAALGREIYFDENLSNPVGQSCASCHLPTAGFADPDSNFPVSEGAVTGRFGARNAPTASYAAFIPEFRFVFGGGGGGGGGGGHYEGGQFWDGRASTLELQAQGPFLGILEMNMTDRDAVIEQLRISTYASEFAAVFGDNALDDVDQAYQQISQAIAEFERSSFFSPFSSKFDAVMAGTEVFTLAEQNGRNLFNGKANCNRCHRAGPNSIFSDFEYKNIGVPPNPSNPFLALSVDLNPDGSAFVDSGLGAVLNEADQNGKFRTPTLRNIGATAPYMHNGVFDSIEAVIDFYNRRDVDAVIPEVAQNVDNAGNIGNLNLSAAEIQDLAAFLRTLTDGYQ